LQGPPEEPPASPSYEAAKASHDMAMNSIRNMKGRTGVQLTQRLE
jgi:hypothetical protein